MITRNDLKINYDYAPDCIKEYSNLLNDISINNFYSLSIILLCHLLIEPSKVFCYLLVEVH